MNQRRVEVPREVRDRHIREILEVMTRGEWAAGRSHRELQEQLEAEGYELSLGTLQSWSAEAALVLRMCRGGPEQIREEILQGIRRVGQAALERKREMVTQKGEVFELKDPDCRTALQALVEMAILNGVREERTHTRVDVQQLSEAEIVRQLAEQGYEIRKIEPALLAEGEEKK